MVIQSRLCLSVSTVARSLHASAALAMTVILGLMALGCTPASSRQRLADLNRMAPDFDAQTVDGALFHSSTLRGRVVVLYIWAAWECVDELPGFDVIASRLSLRGVAVVAVSIDRDIEVVRRIAHSRSEWRLEILHDRTGRVAKSYDPSGFPAAYIVDRSGAIRHAFHGVGLRDIAVIESHATELAAR